MISGRLQWSILISAVLLVVAAALVFLERSPQQKSGITHSSEETAAQLRWREGSSQQYDVVVDSSFEMTMRRRCSVNSSRSDGVDSPRSFAC